MALNCPKCGVALREPPPKFCTHCGADLVLHSPKVVREEEKKPLLMFAGAGLLGVLLLVGIYIKFIRKAPEAPPEIMTPTVPREDPTQDEGFQQMFLTAYNAYADYHQKIALWYPPLYDSFLDASLLEGATEAVANLDTLFQKLEPYLVDIDKNGGVDRFRDLLDATNTIVDPVVAAWFCDKKGCPLWVTEKAGLTQKGDLTFACDRLLFTLRVDDIDHGCTHPRDRANLTVKQARSFKRYKGKYDKTWLDEIQEDARTHRQHGYAWANYGYMLMLVQKQENQAYMAYNTADVAGRGGKDHENWVVSLKLADLNQKSRNYTAAQEHFARAFHNAPEHNPAVRSRVGLMALASLQNDAGADRSLAIIGALRQEGHTEAMLDYYEARALAKRENFEEALPLMEKYRKTLKDPAEIEKIGYEIDGIKNLLKTRDRMKKLEEERALKPRELQPKEETPKGNFVKLAPVQPGAASGSAAASN